MKKNLAKNLQHSSIKITSVNKNLKEKIENGPKDKIYDIDLAYITSRGKWYHYSWKGDIQKSGGIATNIEFISSICFHGFWRS